MCLALLLAASDAFASLPLLDTDKPSDAADNLMVRIDGGSYTAL
jgi:hypothetical protein